MYVTCMNGNRKNRVWGSRVSVYTNRGTLVERFHVPKRYGTAYCEKHPTGYYGKLLRRAIAMAEKLDREEPPVRDANAQR